jgi:hypothetical protein
VALDAALPVGADPTETESVAPAAPVGTGWPIYKFDELVLGRDKDEVREKYIVVRVAIFLAFEAASEGTTLVPPARHSMLFVPSWPC